MRIAIILLEDFPGSDNRVQRQSSALRDAGHEVRVFAATGPSVEAEWQGVAIERSSVRRVKAGSKRRRLWEYTAFCLSAFGWTWSVARRWKPDVVQVANMPDWLVFSALPARWFSDSRIVLDLHDPMPELWIAKSNHTWLRALLVWLEGASIRRADRCIVATGPMSRAIEARHAGVRCEVVMNAVDEVNFPRTEPKAPRTDGFVVGFHGTLAQRFGVGAVVEAVAAFRSRGHEVRFVVVGDGDAAPALKARVQELGLGDSVEFLGQKLASDLSAIITRFDVATVPYLDSPFMRLAYSSKSLEYAISGIPMLVTDLPAMHDLFDETEVRYVAPGDAQAVDRSTREAAESPEAMREMATRAQRRVEQHTWRAVAPHYVTLVEETQPRSRKAHR